MSFGNFNAVIISPWMEVLARECPIQTAKFLVKDPNFAKILLFYYSYDLAHMQRENVAIS